ncbi:MAG: two-component system LytT family response regulator [Flavobacteriales bacterium]|jgi:two-component system LytT family response regulator
MKALIIDDERLARVELKSMIEHYDSIDLVGEAHDAFDAQEKITQLKPDLLFLDIQMPGKTGFELLESLDSVPHVIFVTAYDEHALRAFEFSAIDYLLKPIEDKRLQTAIEKAEHIYNSKRTYDVSTKPNSSNTEPYPATLQDDIEVLTTDQRPLNLDDRVFIKDGDSCWFVSLREIRLLESLGNYTQVFFGQNKAILRRSLNQLEQKLPEEFFRLNRQNIANLKYVQSIDSAVNGNLELLLSQGECIELSRRQTAVFRERMSL